MGADREELRKWFDREEVIHEYRRRKRTATPYPRPLQRVDARRQADLAARDVDQRRERWR
mgnify:CR=1 FL=1